MERRYGAPLVEDYEDYKKDFNFNDEWRTHDLDLFSIAPAMRGLVSSRSRTLPTGCGIKIDDVMDRAPSRIYWRTCLFCPG